MSTKGERMLDALYANKRAVRIERVEVRELGMVPLYRAQMQCGCWLRIKEIQVGSIWPVAAENEVNRDFIIVGQLTSCPAHTVRKLRRSRL